MKIRPDRTVPPTLRGGATGQRSAFPVDEVALDGSPGRRVGLEGAVHSGLETAVNTAAAASGQPAVAAAVAPPSPDLTRTLQAKLGRTFHLPAEKARALAAELGISEEQLMVELIPVARAFARPPISGYSVGAVGRGRSGDLYLGVNLEFSGEALNQTVHAEQFVVANALARGERGLQALAISAEPCGHCRQFLNELQGASDLRILVPGKEPVKLGDLLPHSFGPKDLGLKAGLLAHPETALELTEAGQGELAGAALRAAERSYAPYSRSPSGVALRTADGSIYTGSYAENAAFNPSLSPLQSALANLAADGREWQEITEVALVERRNAPVSQVGATRDLLRRVAPAAKLRIHRAR